MPCPWSNMMGQIYKKYPKRRKGKDGKSGTGQRKGLRKDGRRLFRGRASEAGTDKGKAAMDQIIIELQNYQCRIAFQLTPFKRSIKA